MLRLRIALSFDGATETVFPRAEALLEETDYQEALEFVASRKDMGRYDTMLDFLYAEVSGDKARCFRYYQDEGPQLRFLLTAPEIREWDLRLVVALQTAKVLCDQERRTSWAGFRQTVMALAA